MRGAPVTTYVVVLPAGVGIGGFGIMESSCIFVAIETLALVAGVAGIQGCQHHFSIHILFCADLIEIRITIFTSPSEL
jgi:hypothetical protein